MISLIFISLMLGFGLSLFVCPNPLFLGVWILLIALFSSLIVGLVTYSWLGIFIYVVYVGGLLVMFSYFVALSPNQVYGGQSMLVLLGVALVSGLIMVFSVDIMLGGYSGEEWGSSMIYLFQYNLFLFMLMGVSLFIAMVAVVKLCGCYVLPLRSFK